MKAIRTYGHFARRGFTLTELAIVLLITSVLIAAIWVAGQNTWEHYRVYRADQQMAKLTQNIREYYMNAQTLPANPLTATLDGLNLFPIEMRRNQNAAPGASLIDNPFNGNFAGGSLQVQNVACPAGGAVVCFRVQMLGLQQQPCMQLLAYVPVNDADLGIVRVGTLAFSQTNPTTLITSNTARTWCNQAGANNEVDWDFKLRN